MIAAKCFKGEKLEFKKCLQLKSFWVRNSYGIKNSVYEKFNRPVDIPSANGIQDY